MNLHYEIINFYLDSMDYIKIDPTLSYAFKMYFLDVSLKLKNENSHIFTNAMIDVIVQCVDEAEQMKKIIKVDHKKYVDEYIPKLYDSVIKENLKEQIFTLEMLKKYKLLYDLIEIANYYNKNETWEHISNLKEN